MATREGLKAVANVRGDRGGPLKALWVMATNPAVSLPRAGAMRDALRRLSCSLSPRMSSPTIRSMPARMCGCRPPPGAQKDATVTIRSGASPASAPSCRCRAKPSPTGGSSPRWRAAWVWRCFAYRSPPTSFASTRRCRPSRMPDARFRISAWPKPRTLNMRALAPTQCRCGGRKRAASRFFADGATSRPTEGALRSPRTAGFAGGDHGALPFRLKHRPGARPVHTMTRSGMSRACAALCRALRRGASRGRAPAGLSADGFARVAPATRGDPQVVVSDGRAPARCSCRSIGRRRPPPWPGSATWWPATTRIRASGSKATAAPHRAGRLRVAGVCADPRP